MKLPFSVEKVIKKIMDAGGQAFLVGGALRDWLLGIDVVDYDIATSFTPEQVERIFADEKTWPSGKRFGTITVEIGGIPIEITTFRSESNYTDNRHPDKITFISDIRKDLSRRDFTVNAMAYNPYLSQCLVDPFDGKKDLQQNILRAVGNPVERFAEDPLRIMRGIRLAAQLDFEIEENTKSAMKVCCPMLSNVSAERIKSELDRLLLSNNPDKGMLLLHEIEIIPLLFGIDKKKIFNAEYYKIIKNMEPCLAYRLSAMFSILYSEDSFNAVRLDNIKNKLIQLKYDRITTRNTIKLLAGYARLSGMDITPFSIREFLGSMGIEETKQCIKWYYEICKISKDPFICDRVKQAADLVKDITRRNEPVFFHQLAINGNDVKLAGIGQNDPRIIGEALNLAYRWVLEDPARNNTDCLIAMLKKHFSLT